MKILIDGRFYGLENAGIGRYVMNLVKELGEFDINNTYILLLKKNTVEYFYNSAHVKNKSCFTIVTADISHYSIQEQIFLPLIILKHRPDLVHFPNFNFPILYPGKFVVTIHDLIKHFSKGADTTTKNAWTYWLKYAGYKIVFNQAVRRAGKIIVPSQSVKDDLQSAYKIPDGKISVTYEGIDEKYESVEKTIDTTKLDRYKIKTPFVIYTGSVYPHKNIERLIEALILINKKSKLYLYISCARNVFWERLSNKIGDLKAQNFVTSLGFVPDEDLIGIYQNAKAFVFPTLAEGFGLPGLEAMAVGCPVVCSNIPVLKEIYGEAALFFNPIDVNGISKKIEEIVNNNGIREKLITDGYKQVKKYSWKEMARQTVDIYSEAIT